MKSFKWSKVVSSYSNSHISLLEFMNNEYIRFWAILVENGKLYTPKMFNKDRTKYIEIKEWLLLKDAKDAVEKKLFDDEIIHEGDTIEDYTE